MPMDKEMINRLENGKGVGEDIATVLDVPAIHLWLYAARLILSLQHLLGKGSKMEEN